MTDNVAPFPTKRERLAASIKGLLVREAANQKEWVEIKLSLCAELVDAREDFRANQEFGDWCESYFNVSHQDRAAYIAMGRDLELAQKVLEKTQRKSIQLIYMKEFKPKFKVGSDDADDAEKIVHFKQDGTVGKRTTKHSAKLVQEPSPTRFTDAFRAATNLKDRYPPPQLTPLEVLSINLREMREGFKRAEAGYRGFEHARKNLAYDPRESIVSYTMRNEFERIKTFLDEMRPFITMLLSETTQAQDGPRLVLLQGNDSN